MPKTYVFPQEFDAKNLDSDYNPNSKAYFELCNQLAQDLLTMTEQKPEIDFETYDPREKKPEEYNTVDKFWAVLLTLQEKDERTFNTITGGNLNNPKQARKYASVMKSMSGRAFNLYMGKELRELIGAFHAKGAEGLYGLTPEENRMLYELVGPVVGVKEVELAENVAGANETAPEANAAARKLPAGTLAFFDAPVHQSGTTLFETMRNRAIEIANAQTSGDAVEENELETLKQDCYNYIKGKESERATQKGRERFKMALSMLKTLVPKDEFEREVERINGIRAAKWFGRGGDPIRAEDFDEPVEAAAESEAAEASKLPANLGGETEQRGFRPEIADAAQAFFASAAHGKGSTRYNAMRDSVKALLEKMSGDPNNIPTQEREAAVAACRAYIERKENERVTQSGRERFRMAMTMLRELLPPNEFKQEIERINAVRRGTPLKADEYATDKNTSALNAAAGKRDYYGAYEEEHDELFAILNGKNVNDRVVGVTGCLTKMMHFWEQRSEKGLHVTVDEDAMLKYARGMLGMGDHSEMKLDDREVGLLVAVNKLIDDPDYRGEMLSEEQLKNGMPLLKKEIVKEELRVGMRPFLSEMEKGTCFNPKDETILFDRTEELETQLAHCAAAQLLAREAEEKGNATMLDLHSVNGKIDLQNKAAELRKTKWFKATMGEIITTSAGKQSSFGDMSLNGIIEALNNNDPTKLLTVYDKMQKRELGENELTGSLDEYDVHMQHKFRTDKGVIVRKDSPAGQMHLAFLEAKNANSSSTSKAAIANVLAARLVCENHQDKFNQTLATVEQEKREYVRQMMAQTEPEGLSDQMKFFRSVIKKAATSPNAFKTILSAVKKSEMKTAEKESELNEKLTEAVNKIDKAREERRQKREEKKLSGNQNENKKDEAAANAGSGAPSMG